MDVVDRDQIRDEGMIARRTPAARMCMRCGDPLAGMFLIRNPDALDCGGTCPKAATDKSDGEN